MKPISAGQTIRRKGNIAKTGKAQKSYTRKTGVNQKIKPYRGLNSDVNSNS